MNIFHADRKRVPMELVEYIEEFGPVSYPEGFEANLEGLTIEEQLKFFRLGNGLYLKKTFSERRINSYDAAYHLDETEEVKAIVLKDGKIAGIKVHNRLTRKDEICGPESGYYCRYAEELDGSGYKTFSLRLYLICVSDQFELGE